jgi:hypothetical protein
MRALHSIDKKVTAAAALLIAGAVTLAGCGTRDLSDARVQTALSAATTNGGQPMAVSCEPTQRAIVRPVVVNGAAMSQVECVSSGLVAGVAPAGFQPAPAAIPATYYPTAVAQPVALENAQLVQAPAARPVAQRTAYQRAPERIVRPKRSVKTSAIIIGSSAGAGAGLGALIGGKKGALIGAAVGGGGATLWDQITRNKDR